MKKAPVRKQRDSIIAEKIAAAKKARGEKAEATWIAKLKEEHGDGWEEIFRESQERSRANDLRAKAGQLTKLKKRVEAGRSETSY